MFEGKSADEETRSRCNDLRTEPKLTKVVRCGFELGDRAGEMGVGCLFGAKGRSERRELRVGIPVGGRTEDGKAVMGAADEAKFGLGVGDIRRATGIVGEVSVASCVAAEVGMSGGTRRDWRHQVKPEASLATSSKLISTLWSPL